jgi:hypothetical protein
MSGAKRGTSCILCGGTRRISVAATGRTVRDAQGRERVPRAKARSIPCLACSRGRVAKDYETRLEGLEGDDMLDKIKRFYGF